MPAPRPISFPLPIFSEIAETFLRLQYEIYFSRLQQATVLAFHAQSSPAFPSHKPDAQALGIQIVFLMEIW